MQQRPFRRQPGCLLPERECRLPERLHPVWLDLHGNSLLRDGRAHLSILGEGPERARLQAEVQKQQLGAQVLLPGAVESARRLMAAFDVFVISSRMEGIPLAMLEAMATNLPTIATNVGGIPEIIRDGQNGRLVPSQDPFALAQALVEILTRPSLQEQLRQEGLKTARQFSVERMMEETLKVYAQVINGDL